MQHEEIHIKLQQIMQKIYQKPISGFFDTIPNPQQEPQYLILIDSPMSLGIIKNKVDNKQYQNYTDFVQDFDLFHRNIQKVYGSPSLTLTMFKFLYEIMDLEIKKLQKNYNEVITDLRIKLSNLNDDIANDHLQIANLVNSKFDLNQLVDNEIMRLIDSIQKGFVSLRSVTKYFKCKPKTFHTFIETFSEKKKLNIKLNLKSGRKAINISENTLNKYKEIHNTWNGGFRSIGNILNLTEWGARKASNILYPPQKVEKKKIQHDKRYHASRVNYLWHCDIHFLNGKPPFVKTHYLIAFIDDFSRKIIYWEIGEFKTMDFASSALINCLRTLNQDEKPFEITTDNGLEFKGIDFEKSLKDNGILHYTIRPRNPEENAKIERWWPTVEKLVNYNDISVIVYIYNNILCNSALKEYFDEDITPEKAYSLLPHFDIDRDGIFNIIQYTP